MVIFQRTQERKNNVLFSFEKKKENLYLSKNRKTTESLNIFFEDNLFFFEKCFFPQRTKERQKNYLVFLKRIYEGMPEEQFFLLEMLGWSGGVGIVRMEGVLATVGEGGWPNHLKRNKMNVSFKKEWFVLFWTSRSFQMKKITVNDFVKQNFEAAFNTVKCKDDSPLYTAALFLCQIWLVFVVNKNTDRTHD